MPRLAYVMAVSGILWLLLAGGAGAQVAAQDQPPADDPSIRDAVKQHVRKEIDRKPPRSAPAAPAPPTQARSAPASSAPPPSADPAAPAASFSFSTDTAAATPPARSADGRELPLRVLGKYLQLDLKLDGGYRGWIPQQYPTVKVDVAGYYTWSVDLKAKLFKFLSVHRGYYESNALERPRTSEAAVAATVGEHIPKAAWLLGAIGFPVLKVWEPIIRYEARAFNTTATPREPVCIVSRDTSADLKGCPRTSSQLDMVSSFETLLAGVQYNSDKDGSPVLRARRGPLPPIYAGLGLMSYSKPYQVTIDGNTLKEYLFDGRFRGAGLALGTSFDGGIRSFYGYANIQGGVGQVSLTRDLTLNELAPEGWLIGYLQGDLALGYRFVLIEGPPTLILALGLSGGGASFHFLQSKAQAGRQGETPSVNWDFMWSARASFLVPL